MTVRELMTKLSQMPPGAKVIVNAEIVQELNGAEAQSVQLLEVFSEYNVEHEVEVYYESWAVSPANEVVVNITVDNI